MEKMVGLEEVELLGIIVTTMAVAVAAIPEVEAPIWAMVQEDLAVAIMQGRIS